MVSLIVHSSQSITDIKKSIFVHTRSVLGDIGKFFFLFWRKRIPWEIVEIHEISVESMVFFKEQTQFFCFLVSYIWKTEIGFWNHPLGKRRENICTFLGNRYFLIGYIMHFMEWFWRFERIKRHKKEREIILSKEYYDSRIFFGHIFPYWSMNMNEKSALSDTFWYHERVILLVRYQSIIYSKAWYTFQAKGYCASRMRIIMLFFAKFFII